jgi:CDP-glucose 4,6-dehydratase
MIDGDFWGGRKVFITGHTGFKGSWLCLWLHSMKANITGYALKPPTTPSLFEICKIDKIINSFIADIRYVNKLKEAMTLAGPEIVIHMAAQSLVKESYDNPKETFDVNVIGTVNLFEAIRSCKTVKVVIIITSDKCYENREWIWGYRENDPLGGYDPYSSSKACSEMVTSAYRNSFFNPKNYNLHGIAICSARAGNVIGGGDWAADRVVPDCVKALQTGRKIKIRNPHAVRPWQHVLEPLCGYLMLAEKLFAEGPGYSNGWNFGPDDNNIRTVEYLVKTICEKWGPSASYETQKGEYPHEAQILKLDCSMAKSKLGWIPKWNLEETVDRIVSWTKNYVSRKDMFKECLGQIEDYSKTTNR